MRVPAADPTFDADGYPTTATLRAIRAATPAAALDLARAAWRYPDYVREELRPEEAQLVDAEPGARYLRFATGGWSGNESIISALHANALVRVACWELSGRGGLHIYRYPRAE